MIVLLSGGLDSAVLAAHLAREGFTLEAVTIDYGQRHARELTAAANVAQHLGIRHDVVDYSGLRPLLAGSALTDDSVPVPHGHYADTVQAATIVPNRNAILLMTAVGIAAARGHGTVACAVHAGDHHVYPDCRPEFIEAADQVARAATAGCGDVTITAPFISYTKTDIVRLGCDIDAPFGLTWSCYLGGEQPCQRCGACTERAESFAEVGAPDPLARAAS